MTYCSLNLIVAEGLVRQSLSTQIARHRLYAPQNDGRGPRHLFDKLEIVSQAPMDEMDPWSEVMPEVLLNDKAVAGDQVRIEVTGDRVRQVPIFHRIDDKVLDRLP